MLKTTDTKKKRRSFGNLCRFLTHQIETLEILKPILISLILWY
jgi:hypothetical protein